MVKRGSRAPHKAVSAEKPDDEEDRNDTEHSGIQASKCSMSKRRRLG